MQFTIFILIGLILGTVINTNTQHSTLRLYFRILYKFQQLLHNSFGRYYITKIILPQEKDVLIRETGHVHNCLLSFTG